MSYDGPNKENSGSPKGLITSAIAEVMPSVILNIRGVNLKSIWTVGHFGYTRLWPVRLICMVTAVGHYEWLDSFVVMSEGGDGA
jgi:hypothetical protein